MSPPAPVSLDAAFARLDGPWSPAVIAELNGQHVKVVTLEGAFEWHAHAAADELFYVVEGAFEMHYRERVVPVRAGELLVVPRGVEHKPVAAAPCRVLLFEPAGTVNTGDNPPGARTKTDLPRL